MNRNIINEYIGYLEKNYRYIFSSLLGNKYKREIVDNYLNSYFKIRYYEYIKSDKDQLLKRILRQIKLNNKDLEDKLVSAYDKIFDYILYLEDFNDDITLDITINYLFCCGFVTYDLLNNYEFKRDIGNKIKEFLNKRNEYLNLFDTNEFSLDFKKLNSSTYLTKLNHTIKISKLYSRYAIDKVFNEGIVAEDKLFVEYSLLSIKILNDILSFNKMNHYILEFSTELMEKKKKFKRLFSIIDNDIIKNNASFLITYKQFLLKKPEIEKLIKNNYKFSVIIDDSFVCDDIHFQSLVIFEKVLLKDNWINEIMNNKNQIVPQVLKLK